MKILWMLLSVWLLSTTTLAQSYKSGLEVMQAVQQRPRPQSSMATITLQISKGNQTLSRTLRSWNQGENSLIKFLAPADVRGSGMLSTQQNGVSEVRVFLPTLNVVQRLTGSNQGNPCEAAFFGSDFSYCDLAGPPIQGYSFALLSSSAGRYTVEAKATQAGPYDRLVFEIEAATLSITKTEYYQGSTLLKTLRVSEFMQVGGYRLPKTMVMQNHAQNSQSTFSQTEVQVDVRIADSVFTERFLRQP